MRGGELLDIFFNPVLLVNSFFYLFLVLVTFTCAESQNELSFQPVSVASRGSKPSFFPSSLCVFISL